MNFDSLIIKTSVFSATTLSKFFKLIKEYDYKLIMLIVLKQLETQHCYSRFYTKFTFAETAVNTNNIYRWCYEIQFWD